MSDPVQEQLLGYVLGALDDAERRQVEESLKTDPRMRRELARAQRSLRILEGTRRDYPPPPGLLERTCDLVARHSRPPRRPGMTPVPSFGAPLGGTRWPDLMMAGGVFLVAALLIMPAIHESRFQAQINACKANLRDLGVSLTNYSQFHQGYFPTVPCEGKLAAAGIFAPTLLREGFLRGWQPLVCPSSPLGRRIKRIPSLEELQAADEDRLVELRSQMSGCYGYSLGYTDDRGDYHSTKNLGRSLFALVADVPSADQPGFQSPNHGGRGQNVLFEDGHVGFACSSKPDGQADDIFVNREGRVAAGIGPDDAVIGPSEARPLLYFRRPGR
jgi:hypothetical protein